MPNKLVLRVARVRRLSQLPYARRVYHRYSGRVDELIAKLGSPRERVHEKAFELLSQMAVLITPDLLAALSDPSLSPMVVTDLVALLGMSGDKQANPALWAVLRKYHRDSECRSVAAMSLASLGDERILPFLRRELESESPARVSNAVASMITVGKLEDVDLLRDVHRRFRDHQDIRTSIANAVLTILNNTTPFTLERKLEQIRTNFADRALWEDLWNLLDTSYRSAVT